MEPLSFQEYICSLDPTTLPRILRICSGVYFQGEYWRSFQGCPKVVPPPPILLLQPRFLAPPLKMAGPLPPVCPCPGRGTGPGATNRHRCLRHSCLQNLALLYPMPTQLSALLCPAVRRDVVKIPSTLEVDVEDVTEEAQHVHFAQPLLLTDLLEMEGLLPTQAEILEAPAGPAAFQSSWVRRLQRGQLLQLHCRSGAWRVLASAPGTGRHFLLSSAYGGRFRRRPRQFLGVRELAAGLQPGQRLRLVVTQDCEGRGRDVPPLGLGDRLEARGLRGSGPGTRLLCHRLSEEEGEELLLPLDLGGGFVEETCDSKKYRLAELLEREPLPCEVRVAAPDPELKRDELGTLPALRLEARLEQPSLGPVQPPAPCTRRSRVEELTDTFYYQLLLQLPGGSAPPPPRPPKPAQAGTGPRRHS
ncbi:THMS2 protein, partial [Hemiprocne comata]|nr:THMS2 protein [Hemiprocne comata]